MFFLALFSSALAARQSKTGAISKTALKNALASGEGNGVKTTTDDFATIPKSVKKERVEENWKVWDFQLSEKQMKALGGLHRGTRVS